MKCARCHQPIPHRTSYCRTCRRVYEREDRYGPITGPWRVTEVEYLERFLHRDGVAGAHRVLGRSRRTIRLTARRLGLTGAK